MTAAIHFINLQAAYTCARNVLTGDHRDAEAIAAALDVLQHSTHPTDIATVRWFKARTAPMADMCQFDAEADALRKLRFTVMAIALIGGILGGVAMEAAITTAVAGVM